ncbi:hypothetical protein [Aliikangiella coralliicola]|uniref:Uncharacterized protein n=1 Tax=Aliikangiella coralliicola TaxID=2592383 RepID=A0A545UGJ4_9GAMM|nr:hypothetical protein [Aliikangiella coralliicola]TQV88588.1 hypothetical protein FLL46_08720 [Aliikangiella coralliicola]
MKEHHYKNTFRDNIKNILITEKDVEKAFLAFQDEYHSLDKNLAPAFPFELELTETESLRYSVFYQGSVEMSEQTIVITHKGYDAYLWTDIDGWNLDNEHTDVDEIVRQLSSAPIINKVPESVKELKKLLDDGYWSFNNGQLPSFKGERPEDDKEVFSWDSDFVLVGNKLDNLEIMKRNEWAKLCEREQNWFRE